MMHAGFVNFLRFPQVTDYAHRLFLHGALAMGRNSRTPPHSILLRTSAMGNRISIVERQ